MKKFLLIGLILISIVCLNSCTNLNIPEGDIKDFISNFNGENAYINVHYGKSYIVNTKYDGNMENEVGKHTSLAYFDKRNNEYYHYLETNAEGVFYGEDATYSFKNQVRVCYAKNDDPSTIISKEITDGEQKDLEYKYEDVINSVKNFFYSEVNAGFHTGGTYYGDYILKNIAKFYDRFSLNEDKTELTFEINISTPTEDGNEIVNCHSFVVDSFGMVINVKTIAYYLVNNAIDTTLVTEMNCDYISEFDKILSL